VILEVSVFRVMRCVYWYLGISIMEELPASIFRIIQEECYGDLDQ
jgi:hypothetical protein